MALRVLILTLLSVLLSALAQICFKIGMSRPAVQEALSSGGISPASVLTIFCSPGVISGLAMYACSAILWLMVLARAEVSVAYPFVGLGFVVTMLAGAALFGESLTLAKVAGTLLVCTGILLVAGPK